MNRKKLMQRISAGQYRNVKFSDFINLITGFGFTLDHIKGSHHIYLHSFVEDALNLQPFEGEAKPYQIKQFLELVERYSLIIED